MQQTAVITGAASGIGAATAERFLKDGINVIGVDLTPAFRETEKLGWVQGDVSKTETWTQVSEELTTRQWDADILVTSAAYLAVGNVLDLTDEQWANTINVNQLGLVKAVRCVLPQMIKRGHGAIVTVGSIDSYMAEQGLIAYCTSKGGILQFTKALALDHARDGIRVNCVCPGVTDTPLFRHHLSTASDPESFLKTREQRNPIGRLLKPEEIANTIAFLASDEASGITGAQIVADGGLTTGFDFRTGDEGA